LFVSFVVVCAVLISIAFAAESESVKVPKVSEFSKFFRNGKWSKARKALRTAETTSTNPQTLMFLQFTTSTTCAGTADQAGGIPFNVCMTGLDENGNALGSGVYQVTGQDENVLYTTYSEFPSSDCSGTLNYQETNNYPKYCLPDGEKGLSYEFGMFDDNSYTNYLKSGVMFEYYETKDHCTSESFPFTSFSWIRLNYCIATDDGYGLIFNSCTNGKISYGIYEDAKCANMVQRGFNSLSTCDVHDDSSPSSDSGGGFYYNAYETGTCQ